MELGLAAYAFRFAFSQNISSSIEAFYDENGLWEWIFWQNIPLTLLMMGLICLGMRREPPDLAGLRRGDWSGIIFVGLGWRCFMPASIRETGWTG